jgi:hypothetical protein
LEGKHGRKYELDLLTHAAAESITDVKRIEELPLRDVILYLQLNKFGRWVSERSAKVIAKKK